jgi:hypothetical protein
MLQLDNAVMIDPLPGESIVRPFQPYIPIT